MWNPNATEEEVQEAISSENQQIVSQAVMDSNRRGQAQSALNEVEARRREIQNIARTMNELAELFHDMEMMVAEQDQRCSRSRPRPKRRESTLRPAWASRPRPLPAHVLRARRSGGAWPSLLLCWWSLPLFWVWRWARSNEQSAVGLTILIWL